MADENKITDKNTLLLIALADRLDVDVTVDGFNGIWETVVELKVQDECNYGASKSALQELYDYTVEQVQIAATRQQLEEKSGRMASPEVGRKEAYMDTARKLIDMGCRAKFGDETNGG